MAYYILKRRKRAQRAPCISNYFANCSCNQKYETVKALKQCKHTTLQLSKHTKLQSRLRKLLLNPIVSFERKQSISVWGVQISICWCWGIKAGPSFSGFCNPSANTSRLLWGILSPHLRNKRLSEVQWNPQTEIRMCNILPSRILDQGTSGRRHICNRNREKPYYISCCGARVNDGTKM